MPPSSEAARERGARGGRASGAARRGKRDMRERLETLLAGTRDGVTGADALALALFEKALSGDVKAFAAIMAGVGDAPGKRYASRTCRGWRQPPICPD